MLKLSAGFSEPRFSKSDWNHERVFLALCARGEKTKDPARPNQYVQLYPQELNCAVLYGPDADCSGTGPLHLNPQRESWNEQLFKRIEPFIDYARSDNKGPDREDQNFNWYRVKDWNRFAASLGL